MTIKVETRVDTVTFFHGDIEVQTYRQRMPGDESDEPKYRWIFHLAQIASNNGLPVPSIADLTNAGEIIAEDEDERDKFGKQIVQSVYNSKKEIKAAAKGFAESLPETKKPEEPVNLM